MSLHPAIIRALASERAADLMRASARDGRAARACARGQARAAVAHGTSLRLRDGRWVHLRHDSA